MASVDHTAEWPRVKIPIDPAKALNYTPITRAIPSTITSGERSQQQFLGLNEAWFPKLTPKRRLDRVH